jgi:hypothetical protein
MMEENAQLPDGQKIRVEKLVGVRVAVSRGDSNKMVLWIITGDGHRFIEIPRDDLAHLADKLAIDARTTSGLSDASASPVN